MGDFKYITFKIENNLHKDIKVKLIKEELTLVKLIKILLQNYLNGKIKIDKKELDK